MENVLFNQTSNFLMFFSPDTLQWLDCCEGKGVAWVGGFVCERTNKSEDNYWLAGNAKLQARFNL